MRIRFGFTFHVIHVSYMHTRLLCCTASVAGKRKKKKEEFASASLLNLLLQPFCFFSSKTYEKKNSSLDFANLDICVVLRERENFRWNYILTNARSMLTRIQQQNIPNHNSEVHSECVWLYYFGAIFVVGRSYESSSFCWLVPFFFSVANFIQMVLCYFLILWRVFHAFYFIERVHYNSSSNAGSTYATLPNECKYTPVPTEHQEDIRWLFVRLPLK